MFRSCVFLSLLCVLCMGYESSSRPGYDYFPELEGYLKVHQVPADWKDARATCHSENALLASAWSPAFVSTISNLQSTKYPNLPTLYAGAGLRTNSPGIPMESCENKRCFVFLASGVMDKVRCNQQLPYACFAHTPISSCEGNGYTFNSLTGQCYKFYAATVGATVREAKQICISEGGFLAKIDNPTEKTVLEGMSDGITFIDNDDGGLRYRHLFRTSYSDYECDARHSFICEKSKQTVASDLRD